LLLLLFSYAFYQHILFFLLLLPFSFFYPFLQRNKLRKKRQEVLVSQFKEMLSILSAYLSAGYSLENALFACIPDLENLLGKKCYMVEELKQIKRSLSMNRPLEEALSQFALRSGVEYAHDGFGLGAPIHIVKFYFVSIEAQVAIAVGEVAHIIDVLHSHQTEDGEEKRCSPLVGIHFYVARKMA